MLQENLMFVLLGACLVLLILPAVNTTYPKVRKKVLVYMPFWAIILMMTDRLSYQLDGITEGWNYYTVRFVKFLSYFSYLVLLLYFNIYLKDIYKKEGRIRKFPKKFLIVDRILYTGIVLLVYSACLVDLYYRYDSNNVYKRGVGFEISYAIPVIALLIQLKTVMELGNELKPRLRIPLVLFIIMPIIASIGKIFIEGFSYISGTIVAMVVLLNIFSILENNDMVQKAHQKEVETSNEMLTEMTAALIDALDKKDPYTEGHSRRVAEYSVLIAKRLGLNEEECSNIYRCALLHDIGKIGIPDGIINKPGRLTDEEYEKIKSHTILGQQILAKISMKRDLSLGAYFHHERVDGKGYPLGLQGENIPFYARIISVADAYDAMASNRSYRNTRSQEYIRGEIEKGIGTQFDKVCAKAMIEIIDADISYKMQEQSVPETVTT